LSYLYITDRKGKILSLTQRILAYKIRKGTDIMQYAEIRFRLPVSIKKKIGIYVACCPPLDIWSQGETISKARNNIKEAIRLFLITCIEMGTLDEVLAECRFNLNKTIV